MNVLLCKLIFQIWCSLELIVTKYWKAGWIDRATIGQPWQSPHFYRIDPMQEKLALEKRQLMVLFSDPISGPGQALPPDWLIVVATSTALSSFLSNSNCSLCILIALDTRLKEGKFSFLKPQFLSRYATTRPAQKETFCQWSHSGQTD